MVYAIQRPIYNGVRNLKTNLQWCTQFKDQFIMVYAIQRPIYNGVRNLKTNL